MFHCSVFSRVLNTFLYSSHFSSPHAHILSGFSCQLLFGVFDSRFIIIAASVKDVQRVWPDLLISLQSFKQWASSDVSSCCWKVIWVFHACCLMPKNLSSFNRGASFGNLVKVNFTCCWFFDKQVLQIFFGMRAYFELFGLPFLDNAKQVDCLEEKKDFWANFSFKLDVQQYHLASNSFIFSPRIRQPTRSYLKLAWHDWLKCDQSNNVFFDSSINCDSILMASGYATTNNSEAWRVWKEMSSRYYPSAGCEKTGSKFKSSRSHLNLRALNWLKWILLDSCAW